MKKPSGSIAALSSGKRWGLRLLLLAFTFSATLFTSTQARAEECPTYNFQNLFFEDYYPGTKWDSRSGVRNITWSPNATLINDEVIARSFTSEELAWLREAIKSWDDSIESISFTEVNSNSADLVIGYVALTSAANQPGAMGYWNAWWTNNWRYRATIKLKVTQTAWFGVKNQFIHAVQHELGNVLGLGDIRPTSEFTSTQEDSWQPPFGNIPLSDFDIGMMRQLYGESTCPSTFPTATSKLAAEQKAKQEAEAKAAAELKAKQEAEAKAAAELKAKQEAEAKAAADLAAQKIVQEEFDLVMSEYERLMLRINSLKSKFPRVSSLLAIEEKMLRLPIVLGDDLTTAKYNIQSVNASLDSAEKTWEKTQKSAIVCSKGKLIKKVSAIKPTCPSGYKIKK